MFPFVMKHSVDYFKFHSEFYVDMTCDSFAVMWP